MVDPWTSILSALVVLVLAVLVRRFVLHSQKRGSAGVLFLAVAIAARLAAWAANLLGADKVAPAIDFFHPLFFAMGIANFADIVLFDAFLERIGIHFPRILRDI